MFLLEPDDPVAFLGKVGGLGCPPLSGLCVWLLVAQSVRPLLELTIAYMPHLPHDFVATPHQYLLGEHSKPSGKYRERHIEHIE